MALHCTMTYHGTTLDKHGMPDPWFHYLVVASPGPKEGSGVAAIMSLSSARAKRIAQDESHIVLAQSGGLEAALTKAERFLDGEHPSLKKIVSNPRRRSARPGG